MTLAERLADGFATAHGGAPAFTVRAPGRVNLIGEHTDYNDGFALPCAITAETRVALRPRADGAIRVAALDFGESDIFTPDAGLTHSEQGGWRDYVRGVAWVLARAGHALGGADLAIAGDIPKGTGLSSSASLEVALVKAWAPQLPAREAALLAQASENDFVGMHCGNLDQLASAGTEAGAGLLIDCRSLDLTPIPLPADWAIMIVQSGVVRGLVDGEYNARRAECEAAARVLGVAALRDADLSALESARGGMTATTFARARHVITENDRTLAMADAMRGGDLEAAGRLMGESHASQRDDFGIVVEPTDRLSALIAGELNGAGGARQTGGGFGGAVVGLMPATRVDAVREAVLAGYRTPAGKAPDIRIEQPCAGAGLVP